MKKVHTFLLSVLVISGSVLSSCKKKDDASPDRAPKLKAGVVTQLSVYRGSTQNWDLSDKVTDPQGDAWSITSATSSDEDVVSVEIASVKSGFLAQSIDYSGENTSGTATITLIVTDNTGASGTITATVTVTSPK